MKIPGKGTLAALVFSFATAPALLAAELTVTADTPVSFRATFTGTDTDPLTIGGNDFQVFTTDFWTVLVNLRGDGVDENGNAYGFYEIQLTRTGNAVADGTAPVVNTFLFYANLQPSVEMTDDGVASQPHGTGMEYLSTTVRILYDPGAGTVSFSGTIAGDSDFDSDGTVDSKQTDLVVDKLKSLKDVGIITGKEMGQIIRQTRQPIK